MLLQVSQSRLRMKRAFTGQGQDTPRDSWAVSNAVFESGKPCCQTDGSVLESSRDDP
jgi:hypothetical protein